jgi:hypothetical protein
LEVRPEIHVFRNLYIYGMLRVLSKYLVVIMLLKVCFPIKRSIVVPNILGMS